VLPFVEVLRGKPGISAAHLEKLCRAQPDARVPVSLALRWLDTAVCILRDSDLGLRAAFLAKHGNYEAIEYAAHSASTWGGALQAIVQYIRLVNDAADFSLVVQGEGARFELASKVPLNRVAADFQLGCFATAACRWLGSLETFELWFAHAKPADLSVYRSFFGEVPLHFSSAWEGVTFDARLLESPMRSADPGLNAILRRHADRLIKKLPEAERPYTAKVQQLISESMSAGNGTIEDVADRLGVSRRTLGRHLAREGTSHKELLEQHRREVAASALARSRHTIAEVAALAGYAEVAAFSRALRRWFGQSPAEYRRSMTTRAAG
jgi:AraC-like DNA-binding protein